MIMEIDAATVGLLVLVALSTLELRHIWMFLYGLKEDDKNKRNKRNERNKDEKGENK